MGLFNEYRFTEINGEKILVVAKPQGNGAGFDFYRNGEFKQNHVLATGGQHTFKDGDLKIHIHQKPLKTEYKIYYQEKVYPFPKAKKKDLLSKDVLPATENVPYKIEPKLLIVPIVGLLVGAYLYDYLGTSTRTNKIIPGVILVASGYLLAGVFLPKTGILAGKTRGQLKLLSGIILMVLITMLVDKLSYGVFEHGKLYQEISTNSPQANAKIVSVDYNSAVRIKRRDYDASWSHVYEFEVGGKKFKGSYNAPTQSYVVGQDIIVHYLGKDPRINKHLKLDGVD
jgi:hypothetical protein